MRIIDWSSDVCSSDLAGWADTVQIARDEPQEHDVDGNPREVRQHARRAAAQQVVVAQQDAGDVTDVHVGAPASNASGSRATLMNSSSSDATPCSAGSRRGSPCSNTRPCETNSTRSQTAQTSYMLCEEIGRATV